MRNATAVVLAALIAGVPAWADARDLHWNELGTFVADHSVAMTLPDGARIEGRTIAVEPEGLVLDVRKTSDPRAHAEGRQSIPREQTRTLLVNRPTVRWRIVGTSVGAVAGVPSGVVAAFASDGVFSNGNKGTGVFFAVLRGLTAAGFLLGWAGDHRKTTVTVVADAPH
jgi:hypothetical protein